VSNLKKQKKWGFECQKMKIQIDGRAPSRWHIIYISQDCEALPTFLSLFSNSLARLTLMKMPVSLPLNVAIAKLKIDFQRTLRIQDDGNDQPLPSGVGDSPYLFPDPKLYIR
jgi:hypothetical protein